MGELQFLFAAFDALTLAETFALASRYKALYQAIINVAVAEKRHQTFCNEPNSVE